MKRYAAILSAGLIALPGFSAFAGAGMGTFDGASGHVTTGGVEVVHAADGWEVHLKSDFAFDGAPDPRVGFGSDGKFVKATDFEPLHSNNGAQVYKVPDDIDPSNFNEVYNWCRKYSVPLGVAQISE